MTLNVLSARRDRTLVAALAAGLLAAPPAPSRSPCRPTATTSSPVTQNIGLVKVTVDYSSPDVHAPNGDDRARQDLGRARPLRLRTWASAPAQCPWRAGANENTVFTVSHDVKIEGQPLPAGRYGLHMMPDEEEWTVIFSKNSTSWGSYTYDPAEDALRVNVKPAKSEYREWLTYEFTDRKPDRPRWR